ncbi:TetR family transcriptional regulator [Pacificibacter sp. AS14]|uniref:TetR family transcriptional regulator n=1 Tax=Pacificibacter sp. AS14 TaxID=3135785 RepID=UPI0031828AE9
MLQTIAQPLSTREKLLNSARAAFWARGYSNVSVRAVATDAGVDVALISRYFGSKRGLFDETLASAFDLPFDVVHDIQSLVEMFVQLFTTTPRGCETPSAVRMLLTNAHDDEVGADLQSRVEADLFTPLAQIIGDDARTALFLSAVLGVSVAEKTLHLPGISAPNTALYEAQIRHMFETALDFG